MDLSNSCGRSSPKIFDPALALHWIGRGGSDRGDLPPSLLPCADWSRTKQPSHGDLRILVCPSSRALQMPLIGRSDSVGARDDLKVPAALPTFGDGFG